MSLRIGIDVGGTNTDAVVMSGDEVVASSKAPTSPDITTGIVEALGSVWQSTGQVEPLTAVMIGTTHFANAVVEGRRLNAAAVIRIGAPATTAVPPFTGWPSRLVDAVRSHVFVVNGGYEFDLRPISAIDPTELEQAISAIKEAGVTTAAVVGVFSPLNDDQEKLVSHLLSEAIPGIRVTISSEIGRLGLLERENAAVLNASLADLADDIVSGLRSAIESMGITAPVWMTQNDGTLIAEEMVKRFPASTFASGPTNSIRGAALLAGRTDGVVVDVGGTTTDIGLMRDGFPREASDVVEIGGVRTNFRMPDVVSLPLGGGSIVRHSPELSIGPDSVGYEIASKALVFGGDTMTATDVAVAAGLADIGDRALVAGLDHGLVEDCLLLIDETITRGVDRVKTSRDDVPVTLVGGGSVIVRGPIQGVSSMTRPPHHGVANAVGASIAQVSGEVDRVIALADQDRAAAVSAATSEARSRCVSAGARPDSVRIVDLEEIPLTYLPSNALRVRVRAVGDLELTR